MDLIIKTMPRVAALDSDGNEYEELQQTEDESWGHWQAYDPWNIQSDWSCNVLRHGLLWAGVPSCTETATKDNRNRNASGSKVVDIVDTNICGSFFIIWCLMCPFLIDACCSQ